MADVTIPLSDEDVERLAFIEAEVGRGSSSAKPKPTLAAAIQKWATLVTKVNDGKACCYDDFNHYVWESRDLVDRFIAGLSPYGQAEVLSRIGDLDESFIAATMAGTVGRSQWSVRVPRLIPGEQRRAHWLLLNPLDEGQAL